VNVDAWSFFRSRLSHHEFLPLESLGRMILGFRILERKRDSDFRSCEGKEKRKMSSLERECRGGSRRIGCK